MKTGLGIGGGVILSLAMVVVLIIAVAVFRIWYIDTFGTATENARTNVIRQTNQYVTTQQTAMLTLMNDYGQARDDGQKAYLVAQIHNIAATLTSDDIPQEVSVFLATHPRGSR